MKDMTVMKKKKSSLGNWGICLALIIYFNAISYVNCTHYVTVYYGVPVWQDAKTTLFCAADADLASKEQHNIWATQACVPLDPTPIELKLNITESFNIWENYMVEQMQEDIVSLWDQSLKPCVKLTFLCVTMNCSEYKGYNCSTEGNTTAAPCNTTENTTKENSTGMLTCNFNVTTVLKDKKEQKQALFYREDLASLESNNSYRLINCNSSTITQACPKVSFEPLPIQYCAPAGYALMKCNRTDFNGTGTCNETSIVHCTHGIRPTVSTQLVLNGTLAKGKPLVITKNVSETGAPIIVKLSASTAITCIRPGNNTRGEVQLGPMTWYNMRHYIGDIRKAHCTVSRGNWTKVLQNVSAALWEAYPAEWKNKTQDKNHTILFRASSGGDPEVASLHFNCHGEFFYCNTSALFNHSCTKNMTKNEWICTPNNATGTLRLPCRLKQVVNSWMRVGSGLFAPPIPGSLTCKSNITGILLERDLPLGNMTNTTLRPIGGDMKNIWRSELYPYKVVQVKALGVAPTKISRPTIMGPHREKRGAGLGMLFLGFLSAAGSTMGAAAVTLTVQAKQLLHGIVQQQNNLLRAIQAQQELLRLSVWGIRQLRARLLAIETYLKDQQLLGLWGCSGKLVCYTNVPWQKNWTTYQSDSQLDAIWDNLTWQEWDKQVNNYTDLIFLEIQIAQEQQEQNQKKLLELDQWAQLWSWLDITQWLWYIKIFIMIVGGLIGLRIFIAVVNVVKRVRQGYSPLSLQTLGQNRGPAGIATGTDEEGGGAGSVRSIRLLDGFLPLIWDDLKNLVVWIYQILVSCILGIKDLLAILWIHLRHLLNKGLNCVRDCLAVCGYWVQELQRSATNLLDTTAVAVAEWTDQVILIGQRIGRGILNIPRRIRQGLERSLL
nr:envelope glycoprotein [synthetic construct]